MAHLSSSTRFRRTIALTAVALRGLVGAARGRPSALTWIAPGQLAAARYPRDDAALARLVGQGIVLVVNLHEREHAAAVLPRHGLTELHLPTRDFTAPTPADLAVGVAAIEQARAAGRPVVVHCGAGLGRTGTLIACALVQTGLTAEAAIAQVRALRPGSVETAEQVAAVRRFAEANADRSGGGGEPPA